MTLNVVANDDITTSLPKLGVKRPRDDHISTSDDNISERCKDYRSSFLLGTNETSKPKVFDELKSWLESQGSWINPLITFDETNRSLFIHGNNDNQDNDDNGVDAGTILFRLSPKVLLTVGRVHQLEDTSEWVNVVQNLQPPPPPSIRKDNRLKNSETDCILAIHLARKPKYWKAYLHSLPSSESFDALPRRWSPDKVQSLLGGSPLCCRIEKDRTAIHEDYALLKNTCALLINDFPSFDDFSDAMAVVSSRAYEGPIDQKVDSQHCDHHHHYYGKGRSTIVPLLDLCNHHRGNTSRNITYAFDVDDGSVIVSALTRINYGDTLKSTYGARGNHILLLNYGFCIPNNIENDGSSNDFYEFEPTNGAEYIRLQAGPKAYSYGGFVRALESYFPSHTLSQNNNHVIDNSQDDFEAFLNDCEDTSSYSDGQDDTSLNDNIEIENDIESTQRAEHLRAEIKALDHFKLRLLSLMRSYNFPSVDSTLAITSSDDSLETYAKILVLSELRTLYFIVLAIQKIEKRLGQNLDTSSLELTSTVALFSGEDLLTMNKQTEDLAMAYMQIRHSEF